jgi:hypothetical protein
MTRTQPSPQPSQRRSPRPARRLPQQRGSLPEQRIAWGQGEGTALRRDLSRLAFRFALAQRAGQAVVLSDARELTRWAQATWGGVIGIVWGRAAQPWRQLARRPFRIAYVLCAERRGAELLHRALRHRGRLSLPASHIRPLRLVVEGQPTWGWAVPLALQLERVADGEQPRRLGYWDAPPLAQQPGVQAIATTERADDTPHADDDELGDGVTELIFSERDREDEWTPPIADEHDAEHGEAVETALAELEDELLTQWAAHGIDFRSLGECLQWQQACQAARRANEPRPLHPALAEWQAAADAARTAGRPLPPHPRTLHRQAVAAARPIVAAQASDADLAWHGRPCPEQADADPLEIARRRQAALWAGWNAPTEDSEQLVEDGRAARTRAQAQALAATLAEA